MSKVDLAAVQKAIEEVAAAEIMPRFRHLEKSDIEMKAADDPVTVADKSTEAALSVRLMDLMPGSLVLGEESYAKDPSLVSRFDGEACVWVIDPIDGTRNFIEGVTEFGTIVALVHRQQTVAGWIHDPNTGHTLVAEKGSGVWLQGHRMRLAKMDSLSHGALGWTLHRAYLRLKEDGKAQGLPEISRSSAASFDYPRFFEGDLLFANSKKPRISFNMGVDSKPWDHLAGLLMLSEVGGYAASLRGKPYDMKLIDGQGLMSCSGYEEWRRCAEIFNPLIAPFIGE